jgi:phage shock protein PspC (stress-responsive transcriptional regulator)
MSQSGKILTAEGVVVPHGLNPFRVPLWGLIALAAVLVCLGGFAAHGFDENGLRFGNQLAWRFACLVFFAAAIAGPVTRIVPWERLRRAGEERRQLIWGFCACIGVYLASLIVPNTLTPSSLDHEGLTVGMVLFVVFGAVLTMVIAYVASPQSNLGEQSRKTLLAVGMSYFFLAYTLTALSHLSGPHRPDAFYGFSLILMLAALLARFVDNFVTKMRKQEAAPQS